MCEFGDAAASYCSYFGREALPSLSESADSHVTQTHYEGKEGVQVLELFAATFKKKKY